MLRILRTTLFNSVLTYSAPKLLYFQLRSQINTYSSLSETRRINSGRVISFLKSNGFTDDQITRLTRTRPSIFFFNIQKILEPKLDFFRSLGISKTYLPKFILTDPCLLQLSLENQLIPCRNYLKSLLHTDENVATVIKKCSGTMHYSIDKILAPNINLLSEIGVPESKIQYMFMQYPRTFHRHHTLFKSKVEEVIKMGFDPKRHAFLQALSVLCNYSKIAIDRKWAAYRNWNLPDKEIRMAFRVYPSCMEFSEEKISRGMDFLVNKMGFEAVRVAAWPLSIAYNLEKRIIPRCRVIKVLQSHGVIKKDFSLSSFLSTSEPKFLEKFVSKYEDKVPGLLKIYEGKMNSLETGFWSLLLLESTFLKRSAADRR